MRRRGMPGRRGPGLVGTMARTAVVAGTATAVVKGVSGSMDAKAQAGQQQQAAQAAAVQSQADIEAMQAQMEAMQAQQAQLAVQQAQAPPAAPVAAAPAAGGPDLLGQLQQLAQLREAGALTEEEFQAAKAKLLAG
jgi:hypothetical protein